MQVHGRLLSAQQPVLVPVGLPDPEDVPDRLELRHVRALVGRVGDDEVDVDPRFRSETGDGRRADVIQLQNGVAERAADLCRGALEPLRPLRVVVGDDDLAVRRRRLADRRGQDLLFVHA